MSQNRLWAPWRMDYIKTPRNKDAPCVFCRILNEKTDEENLVVHRGKQNYLVLNRYPYCNGHLMVVPHLHTPELEGLTDETSQEMQQLTRLGIVTLKEVYRPQGFNVGMNIGVAGGAGIEEHLHRHIVPRWTGDTNFMPVVGDVRCMPQHLLESYQLLHNAIKGKIGT